MSREARVDRRGRNGLGLMLLAASVSLIGAWRAEAAIQASYAGNADSFANGYTNPAINSTTLNSRPNLLAGSGALSENLNGTGDEGYLSTFKNVQKISDASGSNSATHSIFNDGTAVNQLRTKVRF